MKDWGGWWGGRWRELREESVAERWERKVGGGRKVRGRVGEEGGGQVGRCSREGGQCSRKVGEDLESIEESPIRTLGGFVYLGFNTP